MKNRLTLARLKNTNFEELYNKLYLDEELTELNKYKLLSLSTLFLNQPDYSIQKLGYRIIVLYTNRTKDYKPLYDVSINAGLYPISKHIENILDSSEENFIQVFSSSFLETYKHDKMYLSDQQDQLDHFFTENMANSVAIVAPTSYGKSDLIIRALKNNRDNNTCIIVPSKALISQTKTRILEGGLEGLTKIITHPDMYSNNDNNIICVLTQERLLRLLNNNPDLEFNIVFVDEAHNLLEKDPRSNLLASSIVILNNRNNRVKLKFLTPFIEDCSNLRLKYIANDIKDFKVEEYIKTEKFYIYDFRDKNQQIIYDQFLNTYLELEVDERINCPTSLIRSKMKSKNIIYLNKPKSIEIFSVELLNGISDVSSDNINKVCDELTKYFHEDYTLIKCLKKGIVYHHGSIPENVRSYIEHIFKAEVKVQTIVTSSTLLEGVNIPATAMFILDTKKGRGYLTPSQFKNLIGRVCRFSEIFSSNSDLERLVPEIYIVGSKYCNKQANLMNFIDKHANITRDIKDDPKNVLIDNVTIDDDNIFVKKEVDEFLKNFSENIIDDDSIKVAQTPVGKSCFKNNIIEIDILKKEHVIQEKIDKIKYRNNLSDPYLTFKMISEVFIPVIKENNDHENLKRLIHDSTCKFYSMFLKWRIKKASYKEMINQFLLYWNKIVESDADNIVYVGKWGDLKRDGFQELWTDISEKNTPQKINLAIVRIKDEQDFLDNILIKFIEVLNDLNILQTQFYNEIKYGTNNENIIALIQNGLSSSLAILLYENYIDYLVIDSKESSLLFDNNLIKEMRNNNENEILVLEASTTCNFV